VAQAPELTTTRRSPSPALQADRRARHAPSLDRSRPETEGSKRGGEALTIVTFEDAPDPTPTGADQLLGLDVALQELARLQPRQALVVESRFFGGFDVAESAELLGVSEATVLRDWRAAKAWLARELRRAS